MISLFIGLILYVGVQLSSGNGTHKVIKLTLSPECCVLLVAGPTFPWVLTNPKNNLCEGTKWHPASLELLKKTHLPGLNHRVRT